MPDPCVELSVVFWLDLSCRQRIWAGGVHPAIAMAGGGILGATLGLASRAGDPLRAPVRRRGAHCFAVRTCARVAYLRAVCAGLLVTSPLTGAW